VRLSSVSIAVIAKNAKFLTLLHLVPLNLNSYV